MLEILPKTAKGENTQPTTKTFTQLSLDQLTGEISAQFTMPARLTKKSCHGCRIVLDIVGARSWEKTIASLGRDLAGRDAGKHYRVQFSYLFAFGVSSAVAGPARKARATAGRAR